MTNFLNQKNEKFVLSAIFISLMLEDHVINLLEDSIFEAF